MEKQVPKLLNNFNNDALLKKSRYFCNNLLHNNILMKHIFIVLAVLVLTQSCATKKEILYFQDADAFNNTPVTYERPTIQPNDILRITVGALIPETVLPYNAPQITSSGSGGDSNLIKLEGYLVSNDNSINFPQLGKLSTADKTIKELEAEITQRLIEGGHLNNPTVNVRLMNAKITILGEVGSPGTYDFYEENITILQAIGNAGDLTINGKRDDILLIRETNGIYTTARIDLTSAELLNSPYFYLKSNDVLMVNPNGPKIKSAGYIGTLGSLIGVASLVLSTVLIITR